MRTTSTIATGILVLLLPVAGCTASATVTPPSGGVTVTFTPPASCMSDTSVAGCSGSSMGFSCTGTSPPDASDSSLVCSIGVQDTTNSTLTDYCCLTGVTYQWSSNTCSQDDSLSCADPGSYGFSCASGDNPMTYDSSLQCSAPASDTSGDHFCCCPGGCAASSGGGFTPIAACGMDSSVSGCASPSQGFSCTGSQPPDQNDATLICSIGVQDSSDATLTDYCCLTGVTYQWSATTCAQDDSLTCTTPGSFGFSCASGDNPMTYDSTLTCSAPASDTSGDHFCCTSS